MKAISEDDDIPMHWHRNQMLTGKDALAMVTFLAFLLAPMGLVMYAVGNRFGIVSGIPVRDQLHGRAEWCLLAAFVVVTVAAGIVGKYLWLIVMSRFLSRANIGPLVAYGQPRRISRVDKAIISRLCTRETPAIRVRTDRGEAYIARLAAIAYGSGAALSFGLGWLPMMRGDPRPWSFAGFFGGMALLFLGLDYVRWRKNRSGRG